MINSNKLINKFAFLFIFIMLTNCSGGGGDGGGDDGGGAVVKDPQATSLIFPLENSECNEGTFVSDLESTVTFEWNAGVDADSYTLFIKNLLDDTTRSVNTNDTSKAETILRGVPYSWYVTSKATGTTKTANSPTWRFYNAGEPVENYAPFPAGLVSPTMGSLTSTSVSLEWSGSDIDNDIDSYDVYLGTNNPPTSLQQEATTSTNIPNISLSANTVYYWKVITKDTHGNNSESPIFEFRTQ